MPAYKYQTKDGKTKWYANFYYTDWLGEKKHKCKRGFDTKGAAKEYERLFLCKLRSNGMPVPLLRNCYSIFNGTKYR